MNKDEGIRGKRKSDECKHLRKEGTKTLHAKTKGKEKRKMSGKKSEEDRQRNVGKEGMRTKRKGDFMGGRRGECPCWPLYCMALFVFYMLYRSLPPPSTLRPLSQLLTHPNNPLFISSRAEARQTTQRRRPGEIINRTHTHTQYDW